MGYGHVLNVVPIMVNTKEKGNRNERKAVDRLETQGYKTERPVETRYNRTDFFNLFDIIAVKEDSIKFIQVKSNQARGQREIAKKSTFVPSFVDVEMWVWHDREGWRIKQLQDDGWKTILDERM